MYEIFGYPYGNPDAELLIYQPGNVEAAVLSPKLIREVSKGGSLTFTMTREHPQYEMLQKMSTVVAVYQDGKEIWRGRILNHEADWYSNRAVYCEGALSYFNDSAVTPFNYTGNLKQFLQHIIDVHNTQVGVKMKMFELGTVTAALGNLQVQFGDADKYGVGEDYGSSWDIINKLVLQTFGGYAYCTYNSKTGYNVLNYCDQAYEASRQTAQDIEYGVNLLDLTEKTDTNDLYNRIYPVGNKHTVKETKWKYKFQWLPGGLGKYTEEHEERYGIQDTDSSTINKYLPASGFSYALEDGYIQSNASVAKFGVLAKIVEVDADSSNDTFAAGVQELQKNHLMVTSYTIKAVDLVDAGYDTERLTFASYAHIISKPHSVDAIMLCTKLTEPLDHPEKKEFNFGMTRRTLTDRQVENMGRTNLLSEKSSTSEKYSGNILNLLDKYKKTNDTRVGDVDQKAGNAAKAASDAASAAAAAAKTATNFLAFDASSGLTVGHQSLPNKKVVISNGGVKVLSGSSMVNITSDSISITDGNGSCSIKSGSITFHGLRQNEIWSNADPSGGIAAGTRILTNNELSGYSAIMIGFGEYYTGFDGSGVDGSQLQYTTFPINGKTSLASRAWDYVRVRTVTVSSSGITFGAAGYYTNAKFGVSFSQHDECCVPCKVYGLM